MTRRKLLYGAAVAMTPFAKSEEDKPSPLKMGIATTSYMTVWRPHDTYEFLEHCHALGASGIQAAITGNPSKLRARAEELGMFIEAMVPIPWDGDT